jgi:hypothetical protein
VSVISHESREAVQHAIDVAYNSRFGRSPRQIRSDLVARLRLLNVELDAEAIEGWALEISEGLRIQIRIDGGSQLRAAKLIR